MPPSSHKIQPTDQAFVTATNIWQGINEALVTFCPEKGPCFKESMRDKIADALRKVFAHIISQKEEEFRLLMLQASQRAFLTGYPEEPRTRTLLRSMLVAFDREDFLGYCALLGEFLKINQESITAELAQAKEDATHEAETC